MGRKSAGFLGTVRQGGKSAIVQLQVTKLSRMPRNRRQDALGARRVVSMGGNKPPRGGFWGVLGPFLLCKLLKMLVYPVFIETLRG
jgi:hypothetical protein